MVENHMKPLRLTQSDVDDERITTLLTRSRLATSIEQYESILDELITLYEAVDNESEDIPRSLRLAFLQVVGTMDNGQIDDRFVQFIAEQILPSDFDYIIWQEPSQVIDFCELLYALQSPADSTMARIRNHARYLIRRALQQFEEEHEFEKMFRLLRLAPTTPDMMRDAELLRLRNRTYLYEMRRVQRNRRILYGYLVLQLIMVLIVFPLLFVNAENGAIQNTIERTADVDLPDEVRTRYFSYADGVYWSLITAASIGYGDVTPVTRLGRIIAATLGVMGVITTGLIAGLILSWIVPRALE